LLDNPIAPLRAPPCFYERTYPHNPQLSPTLSPKGSAEPQTAVLYYKVADLQQAYATLRAHTVNFIDEPHLIAKIPDPELWMVFLRDSAGNMLALMREVRSR